MVKIMIVGHGEHGKDEVARILVEQSKNLIRYSMPSSKKLMKICNMRSILGKYETDDECFNDRRNNRLEWKTIIQKQFPNFYTTVESILKEEDAYVGLRTQSEYDACNTLFDVIVLVVDDRKPLDPTFTLNTSNLKEDSRCIVVQNNGTIEDLYKAILKLFVFY